MKEEIEIYSNIYGQSPSMTEKEKKRITFFLSKVPKCDSILEIGCADGRILDKISSNLKVGVDFSINALKNVKSEKYAANIKSLPFANNSFELIICSEVLEHLSNKIYQNALKEMNRISSKSIMVSVPYKEQLFGGIIKCVYCKKYYHLFLHKRSFSDKDFIKIFQDFHLIKTYKIGKKNILPLLFFKLKHITQNYYKYQKTKCPYCGRKNNKHEMKLLRKIFYSFETLIRTIFLFKREPIWIILVYQRNGDQIARGNKKDLFLVCPICKQKLSILSDFAQCQNAHKFYYKNNILDFRI